MNKKYLLLSMVLLLFISFMSCSGNGKKPKDISELFDKPQINNSSDGNDKFTEDAMSKTKNFEEAMLAEVNFARTNPSGYAEKRLKSAFQNGRDNGAYNYMKSHSAVGMLTLQNQLCSAAQKYAKYMAKHNVFGHNENGSPSSRCKVAGYNHYSGENIACGYGSGQNAEKDFQKSAEIFVRQLIIDKGVANLGHRKNIMHTQHKCVGFGFARNRKATYVNYIVQDFGSF